eukprot:scaffold4657_cov70-Isochrysis_galbana.AAC.2
MSSYRCSITPCRGRGRGKEEEFGKGAGRGAWRLPRDGGEAYRLPPRLLQLRGDCADAGIKGGGVGLAGGKRGAESQGEDGRSHVVRAGAPANHAGDAQLWGGERGGGGGASRARHRPEGSVQGRAKRGVLHRIGCARCGRGFGAPIPAPAPGRFQGQQGRKGRQDPSSKPEEHAFSTTHSRQPPCSGTCCRSSAAMAAGDTSCSEPSAPEKPSVPAPSAMRESPCPANQKMCGCHSRRAWRRSEKEPPASGGGEARSSPAAMSALASGLQSRGATSGEQNMKSARRPSGSVARLIGDCRGSRLDVACAAEVAAGAPVPGAVPPNVGGGAAAAADGTLDGEAAAAVVRAVEIPVGEVTPSAVAVSVDSCVSLVAHVWPVAWTGLPSQNAAVTAAIRPPSDPCTNGRAGTAVAGAAGAARRG